MLLAPASRSSIAPNTLPVLTIQAFSPFSLLAHLSISLTIVSPITVSIAFDSGSSHKETTIVSDAYNFTHSGPGEYTVEPSRLITYVDADGTPNTFNATVGGAHAFKLSGNLAVTPTFDKRARFDGCSTNRQNQINAAASSAQVYAGEAYSYLQRIGDRRTSRYVTWFGIPYADARQTVQSHFRLISAGQFSIFTYSCTCTESTWYAWVRAYTFRLSDNRSVTENSLHQVPPNMGGSTYVLSSGPPPTPVQIPGPERSSTSPPTSTSTVPRVTLLMAKMMLRGWFSLIKAWP